MSISSQLPLLIVVFLGTPLPPIPEAPDLTPLQGVWNVAPDGTDYVKFNGNILELHQRNQTISFRFAIDDRRSPHAIDLQFTGRTISGIYRIEGKVLTVVVGDEKTCPRDFNVQNGRPNRSIIAVKQ